MDIKQIQKIVGEIRARLFKRSNYFSVGMLKTHFKGSGLQFREHRVYDHGDDVRFIDWKMLAKTERPYIKTFEEDRNVNIAVVVDASPSMFMGHQGISKFQAAIEITCLLYLLAKESGDTLDVSLIGEKNLHIPKSSGARGMALLITLLEKEGYLGKEGDFLPYRWDQVESSKSVTDEKFKAIMSHLGRKRELVILSDFEDFLSDEQISEIFFRRNVHGFKLRSPLDRAQKLPYSVYGLLGQSSRSGIGSIFSKEGLSGDRTHPKVRNLNIDERYLENFVKEMV